VTRHDGAVYRPFPGGRLLPTVVAGVFVLIFIAGAVSLVVSLVRGHGPPLWFTVLWLAAAAWNGYWWLGRIALEVRLDEGGLSWTTLVRNDHAELSEVQSVRPSRITSQVGLVALAQRRALPVPIRYRYDNLINQLRARAPHVTIVRR
jgi:hypothetical protein